MDQPAPDAIREQLNSLLASPFFSHSKRFPHFLRFVVEHTLAGDADNIKERTLGIEIFGRDAAYDTASDPIVRVTAAEIRKRVAQYYQDPLHRDELRISLPPGSYVPRFQDPCESPEAVVPDPALVTEEPAAAEAPHEARPGRRSWLLMAVCGVVGALLSAGGILLWQQSHRATLSPFWQPVFSSDGPVLICLADQLGYSGITLRNAAEPTQLVVLNDHLTAVIIDDLSAIVKVAGIFQRNGKPYVLKGEGATNLADLRAGPSVIIGAFDNAWALRLTNPLRYHFGNDEGMRHLWIVDSTHPGQSPQWIVDRSVQMATNDYRDYAIVARFTDPTTGNLAVVLAGIGRGGTEVAGEFLTNAGDLAQLQKMAHNAGDKKNMEVVLSTHIIDGDPGSPKVEAAYFW
ncbi:MAG TPA: hypothetical protein VHX13_02175 [Acidobacteriaceae bacterium]|nr:hypothetical protein [Acidobacteriaceae bacterium]